MPERLGFAPVPPDAPIINNLVRTAHHNPDMFRGFGSLSLRVHTASALTDRQRELVVLRTAARLGADYEWGNHVPGGRAAGMSDEEIRALRDDHLDLFDTDERVLLALADAIDARAVDDELWQAAAASYSARELHDVTMLVAFYGMASRYVLALAVPLDDGVAGLEAP